MRAPITRPVLYRDLISQIWRSWVDYVDNSILAVSQPNTIIDGGCIVAQDGATFNVSNTPQYGQVDLVLCSAGGTVSAGTIVQGDNANYTSGKCCKIAGLTVTGSGTVIFQRRIPSRDVAEYINAAGVFSCKVKHDVGSAIDYTITINKANAADDFSAVTLISSSVAATSVPSGVETGISLVVADFGSCGNGIEIIGTGTCGAVTTKNFEASEFKLEPGTIKTVFVPDKFNNTLKEVRNWLWRTYSYGVATGATSSLGAISEAATRNNASFSSGLPFGTANYSIPSVTLYSTTTGTAGRVDNAGTDRVAAPGNIGSNGFQYISITSGTTSGINWHCVADWRL